MSQKTEFARKGETPDTWAQRLEPSTEVWLLEERGKVALYELKDKASYNNPRGREPLFAVWVGNKMVHCVPGYRFGYDAYEREVKNNG